MSKPVGHGKCFWSAIHGYTFANGVPFICARYVMIFKPSRKWTRTVFNSNWYADKSEIGSLFTLFLHAPLLGFCAVSDIGNLEQSIWNQCVSKVSELEAKISDLLLSHPETGTYDNDMRKKLYRSRSDTPVLICNMPYRFECNEIYARRFSSFVYSSNGLMYGNPSMPLIFQGRKGKFVRVSNNKSMTVMLTYQSVLSRYPSTTTSRYLLLVRSYNYAQGSDVVSRCLHILYFPC